MRTVVFDIEADNLLDGITKVWVIAGVDHDTKEKRVYTSEVCKEITPDGSLEDGVKWLLSYDRIIAHNICGYDAHVLERFFPHLWNRETVPFSRLWDTLIQSRCQWFERPRIKGVQGNHGLAYYGELLGYPKPEIEDWSYWDEEKLNRVLVDIEINDRAYDYLNKEAVDMRLTFDTQIRRTQATSYWYTKQEQYGTKGDKKHMEECVLELDGFIEELRQDIEPLLPPQLKVKAPKCTWEDIRDKWEDFYRKVPKPRLDASGKEIKEARMPTTKVFLKDGRYDRHTAKHFNVPQEPSESDWLVRGAHTKVFFEAARMSQHAVVKDYLLTQGWKPTQYNYERNPDGSLARDSDRKLIRKSPKLTEDSFGSIKGDIGQKIAKYNTYVHRRRTFENEKDDTKGWLNQLDKKGRIRSGCMAWTTDTGRGSQTGCVNVPSNHALYGKQMRQSWVAERGHILVSVDMDSAQLRLLANYMGDEDFTKAVLEGEEFDENHKYLGTDAHTFNTRFFGLIDDEDWERAKETQDEELIHKLSGARKKGKNGIYALLSKGQL